MSAVIGPWTVCSCTLASRSRRSSGPCRRPTLCMRGSGTTTSCRQIAPLRSSTAPGAVRKPLRRHENQRSTAARGGDVVKPPSAPRDRQAVLDEGQGARRVLVGDATQATGEFGGVADGQGVGGGVGRAPCLLGVDVGGRHADQLGQDSSSTRRTSSSSPTGRMVVFSWFVAPLVDECEARLILTSHQPKGRQSSGWLRPARSGCVRAAASRWSSRAGRSRCGRRRASTAIV